jgi:pyridoxamine 5'-phosphate oxidase
MSTNDCLPDPLPADPLPLFADWFAFARAQAAQPNPDAMVLATVSAQGQPSARVMLCKKISVETGHIVFFTNYLSRKGAELLEQPRAAVVFHWDTLHRQVRIEGPVTRSPTEESDSYFATRPLDSRIGAWASRQSQPLASRDVLIEQVRSAGETLGIPAGTREAAVPRPPHWGGHRLWIESIELWSEGAFRIHDRAVWKRQLTAQGADGYVGGKWLATRLNP